MVADEVWQIERQWSWYRKDNIVYRINTAKGRLVTVDAETARVFV